MGLVLVTPIDFLLGVLTNTAYNTEVPTYVLFGFLLLNLLCTLFHRCGRLIFIFANNKMLSVI